MAKSRIRKINKEEEARILNEVAVEYFRMGLKSVSLGIWGGLSDRLHSEKEWGETYEALLSAVCCNLVCGLHSAGAQDEAYRVCKKELRWCAGTRRFYAGARLVLQLAALYGSQKEQARAEYIYTLGKNMLRWQGCMEECPPLGKIAGQQFWQYSQTSACEACDGQSAIL